MSDKRIGSDFHQNPSYSTKLTYKQLHDQFGLKPQRWDIQARNYLLDLQTQLLKIRSVESPTANLLNTSSLSDDPAQPDKPMKRYGEIEVQQETVTSLAYGRKYGYSRAGESYPMQFSLLGTLASQQIVGIRFDMFDPHTLEMDSEFIAVDQQRGEHKATDYDMHKRLFKKVMLNCLWRMIAFTAKKAKLEFKNAWDADKDMVFAEWTVVPYARLITYEMVCGYLQAVKKCDDASAVLQLHNK